MNGINKALETKPGTSFETVTSEIIPEVVEEEILAIDSPHEGFTNLSHMRRRTPVLFLRSAEMSGVLKWVQLISNPHGQTLLKRINAITDHDRYWIEKMQS